MSLVLGILAGLCFGLSAFAGAFVALPLLVLGAGLAIHHALPVALFALGISAAIAAGDAVRARQCDARRATFLICGALPPALLAGMAAHLVDPRVLATIFLVAAIVFGPLLLTTMRFYRHRIAPSPAALLHAPRRPWSEAVSGGDITRSQCLHLITAGAGCGVLAALCAAPGSWIGWRVLERQLPGQAYQLAGTLVFAVAVLAIIEAGVQFFFVADLPGYTAGLFVLGAVAGMGVARRIHHWPGMKSSSTVIGVVVIVAAVALWIATMQGVPTSA